MICNLKLGRQPTAEMVNFAKATMKMHSPLPTGDMRQEFVKATEIINSFVKPENVGPDMAIPPNILANAKGVAVLTVVKAGFVFSGRAGAGVVIARLPSGQWSAPSAIGTAGMGWGAQIGAEVTDFVIILNSHAAVQAFSMGGNVTLGGNLSVSAGPFGRTAEASASVGHVAPIFSYSKSKGLFAGVSIEGSAIFERKDANAKFYRRAVTAKEILSGAIDPPFEAEPLYRAIVQRIAASVARQPAQALQAPPVYNEINPINAPLQSSNSPVPAPLRAPPPPPPSNRTILAKALYDYAGQPGDLSFTTGDIITVTDQRPNSEWWRGSLAGNEGEFPSNYAQLIQQ